MDSVKKKKTRTIWLTRFKHWGSDCKCVNQKSMEDANNNGYRTSGILVFSRTFMQKCDQDKPQMQKSTSKKNISTLTLTMETSARV